MPKRKKKEYIINYWIERGFTKEEAIEKIKIEKRSNHFLCKEYYTKRGFTEEEAIAKIKNIQIKNAANVNHKNKANPYSKEYWISKGLNEVEVKLNIENLKYKTNPYKNWSDEKTNEIIRKRKNTYYAKTDKERKNINKSRGRTKNQLEKKFGVYKTQKILKDRGKGRRNSFFRRYSKISESFFNELQSSYDKKIFYGNEEKWIRYNSNKGFYVDCLYNKKIIEFNGDFYHANPKIYESDSIIEISKKNIKEANEIWQKDQFKIDKLKSLGYEILIIWERDVRKTRQKILNKCLNFLNNE